MPFLDSEFLSLLRCPCSRLPLREASLEQLASLGFAERRCTGWDAGLLRTDGSGVYPVRGGIPVLLAEELVLLEPTARAQTLPPFLETSA
jgi:uncharacterized protein YbaR (Trm112 family)